MRWWIASRTVLLVAVTWVSMVGDPAASRAATQPLVIYSDSLASGWSDWSWNTQIAWQDSTDPHSGSHDVAFTFDSGWDGLSVHSDVSVDTTAYDLVQFWINGNMAGGQKVWLYAEDQGASLSSPVSISPYVSGGRISAGAWKLVQVPLSALGAFQTQIDRLDFFNDTGSGQPEMRLDDLSLANDGKAPPPPRSIDVTVKLNAKAGVHAISPYIYGVAFAGERYLKANDLTLERWGGNATTRYNWRLGAASNLASDWYFENSDSGNGCRTAGCAVDQMVEGDRGAKAASLITVPTIGWVAKNADLNTCGFAVSKYGRQQQTDPYRPNCGNGVKPDGQPITGNDPTDTSEKSTPADIKAWIRHLVGKFGTAARGGVKFYAMDNEPELWNSTQRDVHPDPLTYEGLYREFETYATVVRQVDPTAMIDGPVPWGWSAYFDSAYDYAHNTQSDRRAHGNLPIIPWFLKTVRAHDRQVGKRTLNVLDVHYYPQEANVFGNANDPATDALRLRATRSLWDPNYVDESWIGQAVDLIPRMKTWIARYYPGTKFGISEWSYGNEAAMNGALADSDVLGILGQQNVYLATYWTHPAQDAPATRAFDMFRNYDGHGGAFGSRSVETVSHKPSSLMAFGAVRTRDRKLTVMLVNQEPAARALVSLRMVGVKPGLRAQVYCLQSPGKQIKRLAPIPASTSMRVTVPPYSVELLVIPTA